MTLIAACALSVSTGDERLSTSSAAGGLAGDPEEPKAGFQSESKL